MTYSFLKIKGRVAILKDGEFDHQQFKGHWAYSNPEGYIAQLIEWDREAEEHKAAEREARRAEVAEYLAKRAARACNNQLDLF